MALVYSQATLTPGKQELVEAWLPRQPWFPGGTGWRPVGSYRFDDPAGEVGLEAMILRGDDGVTLHVPLTYRGEAAPGAGSFLVGRMEHSVLGTRWVYDGVGDPVWRLALATAIVTGADQAEILVEADGERVRREPTTTVLGSGSPGSPVPPPADLDLVVVRVVGEEVEADETLTATWTDGGAAPVTMVVAGLSRR